MPKIRLFAECGRQKSEDVVEIPDREWAAMTETQRAQELDGLYETHLANFVSGGATVLDDTEG